MVQSEKEIVKTDLMEGFQEFNPQVNMPSQLASAPGNYIVVLREGSSLPQAGDNVVMKEFEGLRVIYTGISSNLRNRIGHDHLKGHSSFSTFRISLGCLLGFKQIHRDKIPDGKHFRFSREDEAILSQWIRENLIFYYKASPDYEQKEIQLIDSLSPPMNLDGNESPVNAQFRTMLKGLRARRPI